MNRAGAGEDRVEVARVVDRDDGVVIVGVVDGRRVADMGEGRVGDGRENGRARADGVEGVQVAIDSVLLEIGRRSVAVPVEVDGAAAVAGAIHGGESRDGRRRSVVGRRCRAGDGGIGGEGAVSGADLVVVRRAVSGGVVEIDGGSRGSGADGGEGARGGEAALDRVAGDRIGAGAVIAGEGPSDGDAAALIVESVVGHDAGGWAWGRGDAEGAGAVDAARADLACVDAVEAIDVVGGGDDAIADLVVG